MPALDQAVTAHDAPPHILRLQCVDYGHPVKPPNTVFPAFGTLFLLTTGHYANQGGYEPGGIVSEAMLAMFAARHELTTRVIPYRLDESNLRDEILPAGKDSLDIPFYVIAKPAQLSQAAALIATEMADCNSARHPRMDFTLLRYAVTGNDHPKLGGWMDLENGILIWRNHAMYSQAAAHYGLTPVAEVPYTPPRRPEQMRSDSFAAANAAPQPNG